MGNTEIYGVLEKNIILGSANASPNMIFFKDPIYFRITHLSVDAGFCKNKLCFKPLNSFDMKCTLLLMVKMNIKQFLFHSSKIRA